VKIQPVEYMVWAKTKPKAAINLSRSGVAGLSREDLGISWDGLELNGDHPYGYPPLLEAIAERYGADVSEICPSLGASQGIFHVCAALLESGDEVLVEKPTYEPLVAVPRFCGATVVRFERRFADGHRPDPGEFRKVMTPRTRLVVMTNPHNPSGVALSREEIRELAGIAEERGAFILVDEIYLEFLAGEKGRTAFGLAPNILVTSSLTKVFGLSGLRCGWILARRDVASELRAFMDYQFVEPVFIAEQIAARAFARLDDLRGKTFPLVRENRRLVDEFMRTEPSLEWVPPDQGIMGFPRLSKDLDSRDLARRLFDEFDTAIVPGHFFEEPRHFRLGFGIPAGTLALGLENLRACLA
jgi:aspartate/methionine/tyrosine aminotransferase